MAKYNIITILNMDCICLNQTILISVIMADFSMCFIIPDLKCYKKTKILTQNILSKILLRFIKII